MNYISSFRFLATNFYTYPIRFSIYVLIFFLLVYFRESQPLRSRKATPFIIITTQMIEISLKFLQENLSAEIHVQYNIYCIFSFCYLFPIIQL